MSYASETVHNVYIEYLNQKLTAAGKRKLLKYIEDLIDVAAQGNAGFAEWHAYDLLRIIVGNTRKRGR